MEVRNFYKILHLKPLKKIKNQTPSLRGSLLHPGFASFCQGEEWVCLSFRALALLSSSPSLRQDTGNLHAAVVPGGRLDLVSVCTGDTCVRWPHRADVRGVACLLRLSMIITLGLLHQQCPPQVVRLSGRPKCNLPL